MRGVLIALLLVLLTGPYPGPAQVLVQGSMIPTAEQTSADAFVSAGVLTTHGPMQCCESGTMDANASSDCGGACVFATPATFFESRAREMAFESATAPSAPLSRVLHVFRPPIAA